MDKYSDIEREIILFADKRKEIRAISRGCDPEEGNGVYWLLTGNNPYSRDLEDEISRLVLKLPNGRGYFDVMHWPTEPISNLESFLGEVIRKKSVEKV